MSLKLRKDKKTGVYHVTGTINGQRVRESTRTTSREHAEAVRRELEKDLLDRSYLTDANTWADAMNIYAEKGGEKRFLKPLLEYFGAMRLKDITPKIVSRFAQDNYGHLQPASVKRFFYTPMNAVMRAAHRAHLCPLIRFEPPKVERKPVAYADERWLRLFWDNSWPRIRLAVVFMTLTGARVSEICRLTVGDLDLDRASAVLRKTKNGKSRRVALSAAMVDELRQWLLSEKLLDAGQSVFGYSGRWSVNQAIERVCDKVNLAAGCIRFSKRKSRGGNTYKDRVEIAPLAMAYLTSHQVGRHAFAARLLAEGKSLKLLQEAGGWASIQIVSDTYGHLERSAIDEAMRETGDGLFTKMGSQPPMLPKPENCGQDSGKVDGDDVLVQAMKRRHQLENAGKWMVGATGIEPVTPTMSRKVSDPDHGAEFHKNQASSGAD